MNRIRTILSALDKAGRTSEDAVLVLILTGLILLAAGQIVMRNFLNVGFIWTDELLRMLVLWVAVAGAVAASRTGKHINIAVLDRFLPGKIASLTHVLIHGFTAGICGIVTWHSIRFVQTSRAFEDVLLGQVPAWILQLVLPVGFGLITWRYALFAVKDAAGLLRGPSQ